MAKIRRALLDDLFEVSNILIEEMHTEVGIGKINKIKVIEYIKYLIEEGIVFILQTSQVKRKGGGLEIAGMTGGHITKWWWSDQEFLSEDFTFVRKKFRRGSTAVRLMKRMNAYAKKNKLLLVTGIFNDVEYERKNKLFSKIYKPFGFIYLGGDLNKIGRR
tara:strand:+ start:161 stop:643 length:483 start_codon:yes stop_codon:yes gene_type:complete